jgi:hypothetical protein
MSLLNQIYGLFVDNNLYGISYHLNTIYTMNSELHNNLAEIREMNVYNCHYLKSDKKLFVIKSINNITEYGKLYVFNRTVAFENNLFSEICLLNIIFDVPYDSDEFYEFVMFIKNQEIFKDKISNEPIKLDHLYL